MLCVFRGCAGPEEPLTKLYAVWLEPHDLNVILMCDSIGKKGDYISRHSFIRMTKLSDVKGRIDYISNPKRQEHLYATYSTLLDPDFWDYLAGQNRQDFLRSGTKGKCIEARELIIALPEDLCSYDPNKVVELFARRFSTDFGVGCIVALHHNRAMTNYHIHLIFSERKPMEHTEVKKASRNMFYDEQGRHVRTRKEILDEDGNVRRGCTIIRKGETYDIRYFQSKDPRFKSKAFVTEVKQMMTDTINLMVTDEKSRLAVFEPDGLYLPTKKIGKNNPMAEQIKADNVVRQEWNHTVDEAVAAGVPENNIIQLKNETITKPVLESIKRHSFNPQMLSAIISNAIAGLVRMMQKAIQKPEKASVVQRLHELESKVNVKDKAPIGISRNKKKDFSLE